MGCQAGPEAVRRGRSCHRAVRARQHVRQPGRLCQCKGRLRERREHPRARDDHRRRLGPRHRSHLRRERRERGPCHPLALQRLRWFRKRPLLPVGQGRADCPQDGGALRRAPLSPRIADRRGRVHPRGRRGNPRDHRDVPARPRQKRQRDRLRAVVGRAQGLHGGRAREVPQRVKGHLGQGRHRSRGDQRTHR